MRANISLNLTEGRMVHAHHFVYGRGRLEAPFAGQRGVRQTCSGQPGLAGAD
jgi:hypothetical protein